MFTFAVEVVLFCVVVTTTLVASEFSWLQFTFFRPCFMTEVMTALTLYESRLVPDDMERCGCTKHMDAGVLNL